MHRVTDVAREPLRVLLVEDHAVVRQGLRLILEATDDIEVTGEAGDAEEGMRQAQALPPT